jgi:hypothetical protein
MEGAKAPDRLDELLGRFVDGGYSAEGATVEGIDPGDAGHHGHGGHGEPSVREVQYRGHEIRIATHYEVTIDGEAWTGPIQVMLDGSVVSHHLPQYVVPSALDLVRAVIDQSYEAPEEIQAVFKAGGDGVEG